MKLWLGWTGDFRRRGLKCAWRTCGVTERCLRSDLREPVYQELYSQGRLLVIEEPVVPVQLRPAAPSHLKSCGVVLQA
jgi:hypothetical protein